MTKLIYNNIHGIEEYLGEVITHYVRGNRYNYNDLDIYISRAIVNANPPKQHTSAISKSGYESLTSLLNNIKGSKGMYNNLNEIIHYKDYSLDASISRSFNITAFDYYNSKVS